VLGKYKIGALGVDAPKAKVGALYKIGLESSRNQVGACTIEGLVP